MSDKEKTAPELSEAAQENLQNNNPTNASEKQQVIPVIEVKGGGLSSEATQGESALISAGVQIYQRGASLVRPVIEEVDAAKGRRTKVAQLVRITQPYLIDKLCQIAGWERFDRRSEAMVSINPPPHVAKVILDRYGEWKFPTVAGVITTPTLRPNGTLLVKIGYDPETRLILFDSPSMPNIPDKPTKEDAEEALKLLDELLNEFPFTDNASRSVALSALITPVVRGAFPVVPMHVVKAPTPGSGKSFMWDVSSAISTGRLCPVMAAGRNEEETEKRLGAALIAGQPIISIDNVNGDLGGDALCQIIERPLVEIRILGKSERVRVEARSTIFATGNNIRLLGDMTRRVIICTLDAKLERPELRQFKSNPFATVLADRGKYIAAALTIVRAYTRNNIKAPTIGHAICALKYLTGVMMSSPTFFILASIPAK